MTIAAAALPEFDHEMAQTRRALERVPAAKFGWKPHEKSWCAGQLALHLANVPSWFAMMMTTDEIDFATFPPPRYETPANIEEVLAKFDANVAAARAALAGAADERLHGKWTGRTGDKVHFTRTRAELLRGFVLSHMIHHRGQLTVYLRLLDVPVPSLYGPSADETAM
jgi:uncharacterized damage-inducible protein DinB